MNPSVCPVVVATAPGKGFKENRWLAKWGGTSLLEHTLANVRSWGLGDGVVLLGYEADAILDRLDLSGFSVIVDPEWKEGVASSLRTAFDFLSRETDVESVLVVDASSPTNEREVVDSILNAAAVSKKPAVVPKYRYALGDPVLLRRRLWPLLVGVERNASLAGVLETHRDWMEEVWVDRVPPAKIDSQEALDSLAPRR